MEPQSPEHIVSPNKITVSTSSRELSFSFMYKHACSRCKGLFLTVEQKSRGLSQEFKVRTNHVGL